MIRKSAEEGSVDPDISLFTVLPNCVHVGKSLKSSFSNWWLNQVAASLFKIDVQGRMQMFAGTSVEGSQDGVVSECQIPTTSWSLR